MDWKSLAKAALLGTDRSGKAGQNDTDPAEALLKDSIQLLATQKAGFASIKQAKDSKFPIPPKTDYPLSSKAQLFIEKAIEGTYGDLIPECAKHLSQNNKAFPLYLIPDLMQLTQEKEALLTILSPALDQRAYWLIRQNPAWDALIASPSTIDLSSSPTPKIIAYFKTARDNEPDRARLLLKELWEKKDESLLATLVQQLDAKLTAEDISLLSIFLKEGKQKLRRITAQKLALSAQSELTQQLEQFLDDHIQFIEPEKDIVKIKFNNSFEPIFIDLGLQKRKEDSKRQILSIVKYCSPDYWSKRLELAPFKVISLFRQEANSLLVPLCEAIILHENAKWASSLLRHILVKGSRLDSYIKPLVTILSDQLFNDLMKSYLSNNPYIIDEDSMVMKIMRASSHQWEPPLAVYIIQPFQQMLANANLMGWQHRHYVEIFKICAQRLAPQVVESIRAGWSFQSRSAYFWEEVINDFLKTLSFRKNLRSAIEEHG